MALRKRSNGIWFTDFRTPDGQRVRRCTGTRKKAEAQEFHDRLKAELWRVSRLGEKPVRTWKEAVIRWLEETSHKATRKSDLSMLRWLDPHLNRLTLNEITRDKVNDIGRIKKAGGVANATVNRHLALVRAILRRACYEWEWIDRVPKVRLLHEPKRRVRFLTHEEANRLLDELPPHLREMALFTLMTGLRASNLLGLQWSQVDMGRSMAWIHPDQAKARKPIPVPLNKVAMEVLERQAGNHPDFVFTFRGKPVKTHPNNTSWRKALVRAGIEDFRWHDLRHTFASWHAQAGTPMNILQELGGWAEYSMVQRYAHFSSEHLAAYADAPGRKFAAG